MKLVVIFLAVLIPIPVAFYLGSVARAFGDNLCYSELIGTLAGQAKAAVATKEPGVMDSYIKRITQLPLNGYETDCDTLTQAVGK